MTATPPSIVASNLVVSSKMLHCTSADARSLSAFLQVSDRVPVTDVQYCCRHCCSFIHPSTFGAGMYVQLVSRMMFYQCYLVISKLVMYLPCSIVCPIIYTIASLHYRATGHKHGPGGVRSACPTSFFCGPLQSWADRLASAEEGGSQCMS